MKDEIDICSSTLGLEYNPKLTDFWHSIEEFTWNLIHAQNHGFLLCAGQTYWHPRFGWRSTSIEQYWFWYRKEKVTVVLKIKETTLQLQKGAPEKEVLLKRSVL